MLSMLVSKLTKTVHQKTIIMDLMKKMLECSFRLSKSTTRNSLQIGLGAS